MSTDEGRMTKTATPEMIEAGSVALLRTIRDPSAVPEDYAREAEATINAALAAMPGEPVAETPPPSSHMSATGTQEFTLRAMAQNYSGGHSWDHLDGEVCLKAADEIRRLRLELAATVREGISAVADARQTPSPQPTAPPPADKAEIEQSEAYRRGVRDAVTFLHEQADLAKSSPIKTVLNGMANAIGSRFKGAPSPAALATTEGSDNG